MAPPRSYHTDTAAFGRAPPARGRRRSDQRGRYASRAHEDERLGGGAFAAIPARHRNGLHFPTRGRNMLRVQGDLLASHALGLRNLFVVMGDPTRIGDFPDASDVNDVAPSRLIDVIKQGMNQGVDMAGHSIGMPSSFTVGCALNMGADDIDREIRALAEIS